MKGKILDCFMLVGTALSLRGDQRLPEMAPPLLQDVFTTTVNISLTISRFQIKHFKNMEIQMDFLLHQRWIDPRLAADVRTRKLAVNGQVWKPWITVTEGVGKDNENTQFWRGLDSSGNILYSERIILNTQCTRNLKLFPFDSQICFIKLGTYRFPMEEVDMIWNEEPIENLLDGNLVDFNVKGIETYKTIDVRPSGNFTVLITQIILERKIFHYIFCIFIPSILFVSISYITFWLHSEFMNIRIFLSITNLFSLIYIFHYSICFFPVPYLKAVDVFGLICVCFTFGTFMQNFFVYFEIRNKNFNLKTDDKDCVESSSARVEQKSFFIDRLAVVLYPTCFVCAVLIYCMIYVKY